MFTELAEAMRESGEALVNGLGITKGLEVLISDAETERRRCPRQGWAPRCWASTSQTNLVSAGNRRAAAEGLTNCRFQEGDACDLHRPLGQSFDLVASIFGAMFAPKPFEVAKEMVRVTRPGGRIIMGNSIPNDPTLGGADPEGERRLHAIAAGRLHQPDEAGCRERRNRAVRGRWRPEGEYIVQRDTFTFKMPKPPSEFLDIFRRYYGPTMNAFEAAERVAGQAICQRSWTLCSLLKTRARRRTQPPFTQPSCGSLSCAISSKRRHGVAGGMGLRINVRRSARIP